MCPHCNGAGIFTKPECPPDENEEWTEGHVRTWAEFMRQLGYVVRIKICRCRSRQARCQ